MTASINPHFSVALNRRSSNPDSGFLITFRPLRDADWRSCCACPSSDCRKSTRAMEVCKPVSARRSRPGTERMHNSMVLRTTRILSEKKPIHGRASEGGMPRDSPSERKNPRPRDTVAAAPNMRARRTRGKKSAGKVKPLCNETNAIQVVCVAECSRCRPILRVVQAHQAARRIHLVLLVQPDLAHASAEVAASARR